MLLAIVNPGAEIREGFSLQTVTTQNGLSISGLKIRDDGQTLVLRGTDGQDQAIPHAEIDEISTASRSLMPDALLDSLTDQELRDLFAFLSSTTPPK